MFIRTALLLTTLATLSTAAPSGSAHAGDPRVTAFVNAFKQVSQRAAGGQQNAQIESGGRFSPTMLSGQPVKVTGGITTYNFPVERAAPQTPSLTSLATGRGR